MKNLLATLIFQHGFHLGTSQNQLSWKTDFRKQINKGRGCWRIKTYILARREDIRRSDSQIQIQICKCDASGKRKACTNDLVSETHISTRSSCKLVGLWLFKILQLKIIVIKLPTTRIMRHGHSTNWVNKVFMSAKSSLNWRLSELPTPSELSCQLNHYIFTINILFNPIWHETSICWTFEV